jgi:GTPase involved in cell partitioning and DNA repair
VKVFFEKILIVGLLTFPVMALFIVFLLKKLSRQCKTVDQKKQELQEIVQDAEHMIEELNKFSDYIVNQIDLKNEELWLYLNRIDEKIKQFDLGLAQSTSNRGEEEGTGRAKGISGKSTDTALMDSDLILERLEAANETINRNGINQKEIERNDKVIPLNSKYRDVVELSHKGMSDTEIAKTLRMGKGEIRLVLDLIK